MNIDDICPECFGEGHFDYSECCGAKISDSGLCFDCHDHTEPQECELCKGTGIIN